MTTNRIGIDFSQDSFDLVIANDTGLISPVKRFVNDLPGSQAALQFIQQVCQAHPANQIWIGGESTGLLWWHLYQHWAEDACLAELNPTFYLFNPSHIKSFRKITARQDKTDPKDARLITRYMGVPDLQVYPWLPGVEPWGLRFLTRTRCRLAQQLAKLKLQALSMIRLEASAYTQAKPFSDVFGKASGQILRQHPILETLASQSIESLSEQLQIWGKNRFTAPDLTAARLIDVSRRSFPLSPLVADEIHFCLTHLLDLIEYLQKQLDVFDRFIAEQFCDDLDIAHLDAIKGLGIVFAAGLTAELRPTARFFLSNHYDPSTGLYCIRSMRQAQSAVAKMAGLWWPRSQSGNFEAQDRHIPKACNPYLRYYLVEAANSVREHVADYGLFYRSKYAQAHSHPHRRAIVLTARKLARLVFVLLHEHQAYEPRRSG
jgi:transposase